MRKFVLTFLLLVFFVGIRPATCVLTREQHHKYISLVIQQFGGGPAPLMVYPPIPMIRCPESNFVLDPYDYIRPVLMFWDSMNQLACLNGRMRCPRPACQVAPDIRWLRSSRWKDCRNQRESCRLLFGINEPIYLISRVYRCGGHHAEIIAHDPALLNLIPESRRPFILSHIAGVTCQLQDYVACSIINGLKMEHIETMLAQLYMKEYNKKRASFEEDLQLQLLCGKVPENSQVNKKFPADISDEYKGPSITIIRDCFIYDFERKQHLYTSKMIEHSAEWISIDHTFKVAANIGANRKCDSHWEKQYDSMFCVMNEIGCVIAWPLTLGTAFDKVEDLLKGLHSRFLNQGRNIKFCFTDNCCTWKRKLQSVFGTELNVKLDLFHAVQRVVKKISKRHPFSFNCAQAFSLIFRQPHDQGEKRKQFQLISNSMNLSLPGKMLFI